MKTTIPFGFLLLFFIQALVLKAQQPLYQSDVFSIFNDKVVQGKHTATILSNQKIRSDYQSPANEYQSADISFKFAINGKDNEMLPGQDHHFTVQPIAGVATTPDIIFSKQFIQRTSENNFLPANTTVKIKLDARDILKQFQQKGYYTCFNGVKIYQQDFQGIYIAGGTPPMIWDFDNLINHPELKLKDDDGDGIYETELVLNEKKNQKQIDAEWILSTDISFFPMYTSPYLISNAIYTMSIEEMIKAVEPDNTFRTGKEWAGVWTRDISYSIILSMAHLQPAVAMKSLLQKVNRKKRIVQDTGTGGAYPASTDRMIWAVAAWEVYKATGNRGWLLQAYEIIKNSIEDDEKNIYDQTTGLVKGESSFLDWREQTYPKWMQPADIFESECLGTNAVHFQANKVLSEMAGVLHYDRVAGKHAALAEKIKNGINQYLWLPEKNYYAQYRYGRNYKIVSPRAEALGEALCVLFGIADDERAKKIIASTPVTPYGITCIHPQIPNIPPYHNNAVWPFVQTYWALASAKAGNLSSVAESIFSIYRPAALFLTNKENFVAENGDYAGTQINSSNMLWSLSGNIGLIHKIIFGIRFEKDKLVFKPSIPRSLQGKHVLSNFKYRDANLFISISGYGNRIKKYLIDGELQSKAELGTTLTGAHTIEIVLADNESIEKTVHKVPVYTTLPTPTVTLADNLLTWNNIEGAIAYEIFKNGVSADKIKNTHYQITSSGYAEFQVVAVDKNKEASFASEPVSIMNEKNTTVYQMESKHEKSALPYNGFTGNGFVETSTTINQSLTLTVEIPVTGLYAIDCRYTNGNGPTNTENKCAIRTLRINKEAIGTILFPQRGVKEWSNWGFTNSLQKYLPRGKYTVTLDLENHNTNMNEAINQAMIDYIRVVHLL